MMTTVSPLTPNHDAERLKVSIVPSQQQGLLVTQVQSKPKPLQNVEHSGSSLLSTSIQTHPVVATVNDTAWRMELSPFDQIILRQVTRFLLCFKISPETKSDGVVELLRQGLNSTVEQIPYLNGTVEYANTPDNKVKVIFNAKQDISFKVADVSEQLADYETLRAQNVPLSALRGELLSPLPNVIHPKQRSQPVFTMQANLLKGGLILCICVHHCVIDGIGQGLLMKILSANIALANDPKDQRARSVVSEFQHVSAEMSIRKTLFSKQILNDKSATTHEYEEYHIPDPSTISPIDNKAVRPCTTRLFVFSHEKITKLKRDLSAQSTVSSTFVTHHDALGALAWHCVTLARIRTGKLNKDQSSQLVIPIDCRPHLASIINLPNPYLGNTCLCIMPSLPTTTITSSTSSDNLRSTLSLLATNIRTEIATLTPSYILGLASHASTFNGDVNTIKPRMQSYLGPDVTFVSWSGFGIEEWDFGPMLGGAVDRFRCPYREMDGVVKVLPRRPGEKWEVVVEMEEDVMAELLKEDGEWMRWVGGVVV